MSDLGSLAESDLVSTSLGDCLGIPGAFVYQPQLRVDDAIIHLLHHTYTHLEKPRSSVRFIFFNFSRAFNTIRPTLLEEKLKNMNVYTQLVSWIIDYLTRHPQYVRIHNCVPETVICSTGAPQATVLSPFLFTMYTSDFRHNLESCHLQKFSDDSVIVGCIQGGNTSEYQTAVDNFVTWCELNHLQLNVGKT
ncbi:hypothetical protein QTP86_000611 [Hemibagrus guttatus]|nr:hypothetical protein QTP86_000611 [Hemibagrus guttatus]